MELAIKLFLIINALFLLNPLAECEGQECAADDKLKWSYHGKNNGPDKWGDKYPNCKGSGQSPIDLVHKDATVDSSLKDMKYTNYDKVMIPCIVANFGSTVVFYPQDNYFQTIEINNVVYSFQRLYLRWGSNTTTGSEHTLDKEQYIMEAQFLHTDKDRNIAVVSVLFEKLPVNQVNNDIDPIIATTRILRYKYESTLLLTEIILSKLMPKTLSKFYRYTGTWTEPPCKRAIWTVLQDTMKIGMSQLEQLYALYSTDKWSNATEDCHLVNNFRPVQALDNRVVYTTV